MKLTGAANKPKLMPMVAQPQPPISAKSNKRKPGHNSVSWGFVLLFFMRLLGFLWMLRGVLLWLGILHVSIVVSFLDLVVVQPIDLGALPLGEAAMVVFFAVFDLVAAVGLWLAAPWGGVLWLVAALAQVAHLTLRPSSFWDGISLNGLSLLLILIYFTLSFLAARERDVSAE